MKYFLDPLRAAWLVSLTGALLISTIWLPGNFSWYDWQRVSQIALIMLSLFYAPRIVGDHLSVDGVGAFCFFSVFFIGVFSVLAAEGVQAWAWLEWSTWAGNFVFCVCVVSLARLDIDAVRRYVYLFISLFSLVGLARIVAGLVAAKTGGLVVIYSDLLSGFSNVRSFGQYVTLTWPLLLSGAASSKDKRWKLIFLVLSGFLIFEAFVSQTRGTFLGVGLGLILVAIMGNKSGILAFSIFSLGIGIFVYVAIIVLPMHFGIIDGVDSNIRFGYFGLSGRGNLWKQAWHAFIESPWLGIGPMGYAALHNPWGAHPHSSILQLAVEWGGIALFISVMGIFYGFYWLFHNVRSRPLDAWGAGLFLSLFGAGIQSLVDGVLVVPTTQVLLMGCIGLAYAWSRPYENCNAGGILIYGKFIYVGLFFVFFLSLSATCFKKDNGLFDRAECEAHETRVVNPRFWECGWIN